MALAFDKELKISDFRGRSGTKAEGWFCQQDGAALTDADIVSTTIDKNAVYVRFNTAVSPALRLSYGIDDDGSGKKILRGSTDLPAEPFYAAPASHRP